MGAMGSGASIARALASRATVRVARARTTAKPEKSATNPSERTSAGAASAGNALERCATATRPPEVAAV